MRGIDIPCDVTVRQCAPCGAEWENSADPDHRPAVYRAYQEANGWVTADQIAIARRERGLSIDDFSLLVGIPAATLVRYEQGSLQTAEHQVMLARLLPSLS